VWGGGGVPKMGGLLGGLGVWVGAGGGGGDGWGGGWWGWVWLVFWGLMVLGVFFWGAPNPPKEVNPLHFVKEKRKSYGIGAISKTLLHRGGRRRDRDKITVSLSKVPFDFLVI